MFQKKQKRIIFCFAVFSYCSMVLAENRTNATELIPTLHESSKDLGKAFVLFFNTLGREIEEQAKGLATKIADYIDSIKSHNSKLFSIEQQTSENKAIVTIKGFEHIDASSCCDARVSYNYQNVADKVAINVGPDTIVTISAYESPLVSNMITISIVATIEKTEEVKQDDEVVSKTSQSKAQKIASFMIEHPVNLDAISIEFDAHNNELHLSMPFVETQTKSVRVRVR